MLQCGGDHRRERPRFHRNVAHVSFADALHQGVLAVARERAVARHHLKQHHSEAKDVRARVNLARVGDLLGAHIRGRADGPRAAGHKGIRHLGDAEVEHLDVFGLTVGTRHQEQVGGLEVPMEHPRLVRVGYPRQRLKHDRGSALGRHVAFLLQDARQVLALEVVHDQRGDTPIVQNIGDADQRGMT